MQAFCNYIFISSNKIYKVKLIWLLLWHQHILLLVLSIWQNYSRHCNHFGTSEQPLMIHHVSGLTPADWEHQNCWNFFHAMMSVKNIVIRKQTGVISNQYSIFTFFIDQIKLPKPQLWKDKIKYLKNIWILALELILFF